jgi:ubiquinone/menaquinone biosynthesis C-methylase UbiE
MEPIRDPEGNELRYLHEIARLRDARVIEIGCGDGRLTHRYGHNAGWVAGLDPDQEHLVKALENRPAQLTTNLSFVQASAENLPFPAQRFQVALLAWSL